MSKEDIKKFIKSQNIEVKIDAKTGKAEGNLFQKPKIVPSNNPSVKVGQTLSGKINFKNNNLWQKQGKKEVNPSIKK